MSLLWLDVLLMLGNMMMTTMARGDEQKKTDNKRLFLKLDSSFIVLYQTDRLIRLDNVNSSINDMMKAYVVLNELVTISTGRSILLHTDHFVEKNHIEIVVGNV